MLLRLLLAPAVVVVGMKHAIPAVISADGGGTGASSGRQRSWIQIPRSTCSGGRVEEAQADEGARIRIVSYNVLGPRHGMTKQHGHCPLTLRRWTKRSERLRDEISEYHNSKPGGLHAVCLQEVTPKTLRDTWAPFMKELGLDRHVYQPKDAFPKRLYSHRCLGVAVFYNTQYLEKTAEMRVFFPDHAQRLRANNTTKRKRSDVSDAAEVPDMHHAVGEHTEAGQQNCEAAPGGDLLESGDGGDTGTQGEGDTQMGGSAAPSRLEQDLSGRPDAAVMVRLRVKGGGGGREDDGAERCDRKEAEEERSITLVCAHLWFDPFRPDIKTAQCKMLFDAIGRFHDKCGVTAGCGVTTGSHEEPGVEAGGAEPGKKEPSGPANLIMCGDFNSVPVLNPVFLPGPLKAEAQTRLSADGAPRAPSLANPGNASSSSIYPPTQAIASGVYSLLSYGSVPPSHPEHPDAFIPHLIKREEEAVDSGGTIKTRLRRKTPPGVPVVHRPSGVWSSGFGRTLEDVYRDSGAMAPRFTTKTSQFSGVIDHIFVSSREKHSGLAITGVLAFPPGADLSPSEGGTGVDGNTDGKTDGKTAAVDGQGNGAQDEEEAVEGTSGREFGPIPDEVWGSDHLALGVELAVL